MTPHLYHPGDRVRRLRRDRPDTGTVEDVCPSWGEASTAWVYVRWDRSGRRVQVLCGALVPLREEEP
jgi:hypothetical protein